MEVGMMSFQIRSDAIAKARQIWEEDLKNIKEFKGFQGGLLAIDPVSGMSYSLGLWETQHDAQAFGESDTYHTLVSHLMPLLVTRPLRQIFQVQGEVGAGLLGKKAA